MHTFFLQVIPIILLTGLLFLGSFYYEPNYRPMQLLICAAFLLGYMTKHFRMCNDLRIELLELRKEHEQSS